MKTFEEYLQEEFIKGLEFGGIPITKDNCQDLFENWLSSVNVDEVIEYAEEWGKEITGTKSGKYER